MFSVTIFKNLYDNKTHRRMDFKSYESFRSFLYGLAKQSLPDKRSAALISPATYKPNTTRKNDNVVEWANWAAVDVDQHEFKSESLQDELINRYGNYSFVCYSTASSTYDQPKFRLVFPLTTPVHQQKIRHFWFSLNNTLDSIGDRQTKDLSRMYYIPGNYDNAFNFIFHNDADTIDPQRLMEEHPFVEQGNKSKSFFDRLPKTMQDMIIQHKKDQAENTNIRWSSYRDCPFISKSMLDSYRQTTYVVDSGRYHKMYQMMIHIASNAVKSGYPITAHEIASLCREIDLDTGNRYKNRPFELEANNAIEYAYTHSTC